MEVNGTKNCLVTDILLNISLSVQQKKEIHTGLKQHEGEYNDRIFILKWSIPLSLFKQSLRIHTEVNHN